MEKRLKILVTGSNGQLGSEIKELSKNYPNYTFFFTDREELSITNEFAVSNFFEHNLPDFCINCAAYTAVDKAEDPDERSMVEALNANAVGYLAKASAKNGTRLIHISTDYVFSGNGTKPYEESDATEPVSVYGITKLQGEHQATENVDAIIIRTAWVYSTFGKNFVKTMINLMQTRPEIKVVSDQFGTPTYAADLALVIMQIISSGNWQSGIYHYTNEGKINWFEFALGIKEMIKSDCDVTAISTIDYPTPAQRPKWSVLNKSKIVQTYNISIPNWKESLALCISKM